MTARLFSLSEEHEAVRETVRTLCLSKIAPRAAEVDEQAAFPQHSLDALADGGWVSAHLPEEHGGGGADALTTVLVVEEVARVCASSSLIVSGTKLGTLPIELAGCEELKAAYLPRIAAGEGLVSYCLTEPQAGSDVAAISTRAVREGGDFVVTGAKRWISNAGLAAFHVVFAVTDPDAGKRGLSAFVLERADDGITVGPPERKMGIKGSPTQEVWFDRVRVPADRLIGAEGSGFEIAMRALDHSRVTVAAQALGIAQGALDVAVEYAAQREQFGRPIADFQGVQFLLADMAMRIEAARLLTYRAADCSEHDDPRLTYFGAAAKCQASDTAMAVTTDAVQVLGGYGYSREYPLERMMRDAKITQIYEGTNQIQRIVVARGLLAGHGAS